MQPENPQNSGQKEEQFLRRCFQHFYQDNFIKGPPQTESREFGYGVFGRKIANRNLAFASEKEFNNFLRQQVPFFISSSAALYRFPEKRPTEAKEFLGSDLIYEFDADELQTECKQTHDSWLCPKCGKSGKGRQLACDECGSAAKLEEWFCPECIGAAKQKVFSLLDFLENDFGFSDGIAINFSGRAGYHVHVRSDSVRNLPHAARIELIDYLTANQLSIFSHFKKEETFFTGPPSKGKSGWPARILAELSSLLEEADSEKIAVMGNIPIAGARRLVREKASILKSIRERNTIPAIFGKVSSKAESKSDLFWQSFLSSIVAKIAPIDRQTSVDLSKIIRVPETIHGETGLIAKTVSKESLKEFNPFDDALAFKSEETVKVFINKAPSIYLAGEKFGQFEKQEAELPLNAAVFLLAGNAAKLL